MPRAAIYVRISQDRTGAGLGVARQALDCQALLARRRWTFVETFVDNDVSAYRSRPRPEWQRLVEAIRGGQFDALACWHVDRLTRSPRELEDVIDLADRHGVDLATVTGEVDLATPTGRMVARMLGAAARHESEHKAERQARERRASAEAGQPVKGGTRAYGYAGDRVTIIAAEAQIIRELAGRALAGETVSALCRDLVTRDVRTPTGIFWKPTTMRSLLAGARVSGRREHRPVGSYTGARPLLGEITATAVWPGIISVEQSDRLRALLSSPQRRTTMATGRTYLLSGILRCGRCGYGMVGRPKGSSPRYVCPNTPGGLMCGGTAAVADRTDALVRDLVFAAVESERLREHVAADDDEDQGAAQLIDVERQLEELAGDWAGGLITRAEWKTARAVLDERAGALRRTLLTQASATALSGVDLTGDLHAAWDGMTLPQRRALVTSVIERVDVLPADPRKRWDPDRYQPTFRQ